MLLHCIFFLTDTAVAPMPSTSTDVHLLHAIDPVCPEHLESPSNRDSEKKNTVEGKKSKKGNVKNV